MPRTEAAFLLVAALWGCSDVVPLGVVPGGGGAGGQGGAAAAGGGVCDPGAYPSGTTGNEVGDVVAAELAWSGYADGAPEAGSVATTTYFDPGRCLGTRALVVMEVAIPPGDETLSLGDTYAGEWAGLDVRVLQLLAKNAGGMDATSGTAKIWRDNVMATWAVAADPQRLLAESDADPAWLFLIDPCTMQITAKVERDPGTMGTPNWDVIRGEATALAATPSCE